MVWWRHARRELCRRAFRESPFCLAPGRRAAAAQGRGGARPRCHRDGRGRGPGCGVARLRARRRASWERDAMLQSVPMVHMQIQVPGRESAAVTRHIAAPGTAAPHRHRPRPHCGRRRGAARHARTARRLPRSRRTHSSHRGAARARCCRSRPARSARASFAISTSSATKWTPRCSRSNAKPSRCSWQRASAARERVVTVRATLGSAERMAAAAIDVARLEGAPLHDGRARPDHRRRTADAGVGDGAGAVRDRAARHRVAVDAGRCGRARQRARAARHRAARRRVRADFARRDA